LILLDTNLFLELLRANRVVPHMVQALAKREVVVA
jgi:hypothetical protein